MQSIACQKCDLVHELPPLPARATVLCVRCGSVIFRTKLDTINRTIAWTIAALVLFAVAITFPFLDIRSGGVERQTALLTGIREIYRQDMVGLATLVLVTCVIVPLMQLSGLLYIFIPLKFNRRIPFAAVCFRTFQQIQPWGMMEVFMLGILVALVKLSNMATILPEVALFAFGLLIFCLAFAVSSVDAHHIWERLEELGHD